MCLQFCDLQPTTCTQAMQCCCRPEPLVAGWLWQPNPWCRANNVWLWAHAALHAALWPTCKLDQLAHMLSPDAGALDAPLWALAHSRNLGPSSSGATGRGIPVLAGRSANNACEGTTTSVGSSMPDRRQPCLSECAASQQQARASVALF